MRPQIIKSVPFIMLAIALWLFAAWPKAQEPLESITSAAIAVTLAEASGTEAQVRTISSFVLEGDTLSVIFETHGLNALELNPLIAAARGTYDLARIRVGKPYTFDVNPDGSLRSFTYQHEEERSLKVIRTDEGFAAEVVSMPYERRTSHIGGVIRDNLVSSIANTAVALTLTDVFAWDIDFATGLREGDTFKAVVEALYRDGEFARYGRILAAEFVNDNRTYWAYRFTSPLGKDDGSHYAGDGNSVRRAFLKAPLVYRRISSGYSFGRYHPILKTVRPHQGIDYSAPRGTPVSTVGDGTVKFAGWKGQNGNLVIIKHAGSYTTSYGHLHKIARGIRKGRKVSQGQVIGWVGSTGLATGPNLDYRVKQAGRFVNPIKLVMPREASVSISDMHEFIKLRDELDMRLASIITGQTHLASAKARDDTRANNN